MLLSPFKVSHVYQSLVSEQGLEIHDFPKFNR